SGGRVAFDSTRAQSAWKDQTESLLGRRLQHHRDPGCGRRALPFVWSIAAPGVGGAGDERLHRDCDDQCAATEPRTVRHGQAARCKFNFTARSAVKEEVKASTLHEVRHATRFNIFVVEMLDLGRQPRHGGVKMNAKKTAILVVILAALAGVISFVIWFSNHGF